MDDFDFDMTIGMIEAEDDLMWTNDFAISCNKKMRKQKPNDEDFVIPF